MFKKISKLKAINKSNPNNPVSDINSKYKLCGCVEQSGCPFSGLVSFNSKLQSTLKSMVWKCFSTRVSRYVWHDFWTLSNLKKCLCISSNLSFCFIFGFFNRCYCPISFFLRFAVQFSLLYC